MTKMNRAARAHCLGCCNLLKLYHPRSLGSTAQFQQLQQLQQLLFNGSESFQCEIRRWTKSNYALWDLAIFGLLLFCCSAVLFVSTFKSILRLIVMSITVYIAGFGWSGLLTVVNGADFILESFWIWSVLHAKT